MARCRRAPTSPSRILEARRALPLPPGSSGCSCCCPRPASSSACSPRGTGWGARGTSSSMYRPYWRYLGESLRHGRLPLWDPDMGLGVPFAASAQSQALYPPAMVLFALLPMELAVLVFLLGHLLGLAFGVDRLARRMGWDRSASLCAAALTAGAPFVFSSIVRPNVLCAEAWLPWTLLAAIRVCERQRKGLEWLALCVAMGLLSASPEITLLGVVAVGLLAFVRQRQGQRGAILWCLVGGLLGVGLAAVGLMPFFELLRHSTREGEIAGMQTAWSVRSGDLGSLVLPFLKNSAAAKSYQEFLFGPFQYDFHTLYLGFPAVVLGLVAVLRSGRWSRLLWGIVGSSIAFGMFGGYLGIGLTRLGVLPFGWRYPVKFLFPASVAIALAGAAEAVALSKGTHRRLVGGLGVGGALLVAGAVLVVSRLGSPAAVSLAWDGCCLLLLAAVLRWAPEGGWRLWATTLLCVLDVVLTCLPFKITSVLDVCPPLVAAAKARAQGGRVDALCVDWPDQSKARFEPETGLAQCLSGNVMAEHGLSAARYYGTPAPMGSVEGALDGAAATADALFNVSLLLRGHAEPLNGAVPLQAAELAPLWAAAIPDVAPRVELRRAARVVADAEAALEKETPAEARAEVLLESPPPAASPAGEALQWRRHREARLRRLRCLRRLRRPGAARDRDRLERRALPGARRPLLPGLDRARRRKGGRDPPRLRRAAGAAPRSRAPPRVVRVPASERAPGTRGHRCLGAPLDDVGTRPPPLVAAAARLLLLARREPVARHRARRFLPHLPSQLHGRAELLPEVRGRPARGGRFLRHLLGDAQGQGHRRPLQDHRPTRRGRHGRGLQSPAHPHGQGDGPEGLAAGGEQPGLGDRALPAGGQHGRQAVEHPHHLDLRLRRGGRRIALPGDGVPARSRPLARPAHRDLAARGARGGDRHPGLPLAGGGARERHHPPRHQARQHHAAAHAREAGSREGAGLRHRQAQAAAGAPGRHHRPGRFCRHPRVPLARAGARLRPDAGLRHLLAGRHALRARLRRAGLHRPDAALGGEQAPDRRAGAAARAHARGGRSRRRSRRCS